MTVSDRRNTSVPQIGFKKVLCGAPKKSFLNFLQSLFMTVGDKRVTSSSNLDEVVILCFMV